MKGEIKEVLRAAAHDINSDGVTSIDKGETNKVIKSQIFFAKRKTSQAGPGRLYRSTTRSRPRS